MPYACRARDGLLAPSVVPGARGGRQTPVGASWHLWGAAGAWCPWVAPGARGRPGVRLWACGRVPNCDLAVYTFVNGFLFFIDEIPTK